MHTHKKHCAEYIGKITAQLAKMARGNDLDELAYFLEIAALAAETPDEMRNSSNSDRIPVLADATTLRHQAYRCTQLARECPDMPTAHELEAIGVELMLTAAELDKGLR